MKRIHILTLFVLMLGLRAEAQELSGIPGAFADIGMGARPVAMGGAFTALSDDVNSVMYNPAGLTALSNYHVAFTQTKQLGLINYSYFAASMPLSAGSDKRTGLAVIYSGDKALKELSVFASYAQSVMKNLSAGATLKFRYASFGNNSLSANDYLLFSEEEIREGLLNQVHGSASGFGFDIGLLYKLDPKIDLGLMLKDSYAPVFWNSSIDNSAYKTKGKYNETIPAQVVIGTAIKPYKSLTVTADYSPALYSDASNKLFAGAETVILNMFSLRGGIQNYINKEKDEKYVMGIGLNLQAMRDIFVRFDYTYMVEDIANTQRFSLSVEF